MLNKEKIITLLKKDVVPALGCTEPVCVALCAANAGKLIVENEKKVTSVEVEVNAGIYKNGMSAGIPGCTYVGLPYAAALGVYLKNPEKGLELLEDITPEFLEKMEELQEQQAVSVVINSKESGLYVKCIIQTETEKTECIIRGSHTNVVCLKRNDEIVFEKEMEKGQASDDSLIEELKQMTIAGIREVVDTASEEELHFLLDGVKMNETLAAYSEETKTGVGIADAIRSEEASGLLKDDLMTRIMLKVSSAAESRLDGCPLPTMSSSGAGTKGLVVILPVSEAADVLEVSEEKKVRAIAIAHLVNRYINAYIGKLSPMCSCVMASSTAASVGIAYLMGADNEQLGYAVRNMSGTVTGMICDGGKVGCAMKVASGSAAAVMSAITAVHGAALRVSDGICAETPEECIRNMAHIGNQGMTQTDKEIIHIMESKKHNPQNMTIKEV